MYGYDCNGYNQNGFDQWRYCKVNGHYQPINERGFFGMEKIVQMDI